VLQQVDTPVAIYNRPANRFVAQSIGSPGMNLLDGWLSADASEMRFQAGTIALSIPPVTAKLWAPFLGRPLTLGVRPENVIVGRTTCSKGNLVALKAAVALSERFGNHTLVTLRHANWLMTAGVEEHDVLGTGSAEGEMIEAHVDMAKAHLFDGDTGLALCHPGSG